jgi:hypothetical protein
MCHFTGDLFMIHARVNNHTLMCNKNSINQLTAVVDVDSCLVFARFVRETLQKIALDY